MIETTAWTYGCDTYDVGCIKVNEIGKWKCRVPIFYIRQKKLTINTLWWRRKWKPTPVFLPRESHGRGAWWTAIYGVAQSLTWLKWLSMHACIGEGNDSPLQYYCLENPRDGGAWWADIYGVAQSQTRLKRLAAAAATAAILYINHLSVHF